MAKSASLHRVRYRPRCLVLLACFAAMAASAQFSGTLSVATNRVDLVQSGHYQRWVATFERRYPNVKVSVRAMNDYRQLFARRLVLGEVADVMAIPPDTELPLLRAHFVPLAMFEAEQLYFAQQWRVGPRHYAYPRGVMADGLVYNKAILKRIGSVRPPNNRQALLAMCSQVMALGDDLTGLALNIGAGWPLQHVDKGMVLIHGRGDYFNSLVRQQRPFAREYAARSALSLVRQLYDSGCTEGMALHDTWTDSLAEFESKIGFLFAGSWVIPELIKSGTAIENLGFVPPPFNEGVANRIVVEHDWGLAVAKTSQQQGLAKAWLRYLITLPDFAASQGLLPSVKSTAIASAPLRELMMYASDVIEYQRPNSRLIELSAIADIHFMEGDYVREVLVSSDFNKTMNYLNWRWQQAHKISSRSINSDK